MIHDEETYILVTYQIINFKKFYLVEMPLVAF
jgi:hypothetical protein